MTPPTAFQKMRAARERAAKARATADAAMRLGDGYGDIVSDPRAVTAPPKVQATPNPAAAVVVHEPVRPRAFRKLQETKPAPKTVQTKLADGWPWVPRFIEAVQGGREHG